MSRCFHNYVGIIINLYMPIELEGLRELQDREVYVLRGQQPLGKDTGRAMPDNGSEDADDPKCI